MYKEREGGEREGARERRERRERERGRERERERGERDLVTSLAEEILTRPAVDRLIVRYLNHGALGYRDIREQQALNAVSVRLEDFVLVKLYASQSIGLRQLRCQYLYFLY